MSHRMETPIGPGADDEDLLVVAQREGASAAGQRAASTLLERHQRRVYLWCRGHVRDHDAALDLTQEILVKAYRGIPGFQGGSRFTTWLFAITRNHCLNAVRRRELDVDPEFELESLLDHRGGPLDEVERTEAEDRLLDLMRSTLDPTEQRALWMRCVDGVAVDEITRRLRITSASGARGLLQTARRKLRAALARRDEEGSHDD